MKTPKIILQDKIKQIKDDDTQRMDFLMKTIKAVHSSATTTDFSNAQDLEKQRAGTDSFSRLITPIVGIVNEAFDIDEIKCEWIKPRFAHRSDKVIMYCHGGGYISGGLGYARILASKLAHVAGIETVSFEYRLAPENPYPAAIEDAMKVWDYLMHLGYGANDIIVAGDSAGGNLALELCLELKKEGRFLPRAMILFSPWTDMRCTSNTYEKCKEIDPLLTYEYVTNARNAYAGSDADYDMPEFSPIMGDLDKMPPMLIQVGSNEILLGDSESLAKELRKKGSMVKYEVYNGGWHVFQQMPIAKANHALESVKEFVDGVL